jgi:hypothetical protein
MNAKTMKDFLSQKMCNADSFAAGPFRQGMAEHFATDHHYRARGVGQLGSNVLEVEIGLSMRAGAE